jgi:hypothetical protein
VNEFFGLWDTVEELEELARLSHPRVVLDTAGLAPEATELANRLASRIRGLSPARIAALRAVLEMEEGALGDERGAAPLKLSPPGD